MVTERMLSGRAFHVDESECEKACSPNLMCSRGRE